MRLGVHQERLGNNVGQEHSDSSPQNQHIVQRHLGESKRGHVHTSKQEETIDQRSSEGNTDDRVVTGTDVVIRVITQDAQQEGSQKDNRDNGEAGEEEQSRSIGKEQDNRPTNNTMRVKSLHARKRASVHVVQSQREKEDGHTNQTNVHITGNINLNGVETGDKRDKVISGANAAKVDLGGGLNRPSRNASLQEADSMVGITVLQSQKGRREVNFLKGSHEVHSLGGKLQRTDLIVDILGVPSRMSNEASISSLARGHETGESLNILFLEGVIFFQNTVGAISSREGGLGLSEAVLLEASSGVPGDFKGANKGNGVLEIFSLLESLETVDVFKRVKTHKSRRNRRGSFHTGAETSLSGDQLNQPLIILDMVLLREGTNEIRSREKVVNLIDASNLRLNMGKELFDVFLVREGALGFTEDIHSMGKGRERRRSITTTGGIAVEPRRHSVGTQNELIEVGGIGKNCVRDKTREEEGGNQTPNGEGHKHESKRLGSHFLCVLSLKQASRQESLERKTRVTKHDQRGKQKTFFFPRERYRCELPRML